MRVGHCSCSSAPTALPRRRQLRRPRPPAPRRAGGRAGPIARTSSAPSARSGAIASALTLPPRTTQGTPARGRPRARPATVLPRALWRSTEPSAVRQSAAPASRPPQPDELDHGLAARARVGAERVERGAETARGARAGALRDVAAERRAEPRERAVERLDVLRAQALLRPEQRGRAVGAAERHVDVVQDAQPHAREERARGRELELRARPAAPRPSRRARARRGRRAARGRRRRSPSRRARRARWRAPRVERGAQQIGEAGRARAPRVALARREQREADGLGGLDQERPVAAVADRGAPRAPERVARVHLDPRAAPAAQTTASVPSPPSASGHVERLAARPAHASASASAASKASSAPRSLSGAHTTRGGSQAQHRQVEVEQRAEHEIGLDLVDALRGHGDDVHARRARRGQPRRRVLERDGLGRVHARGRRRRRGRRRARASAGAPPTARRRARTTGGSPLAASVARTVCSRVLDATASGTRPASAATRLRAPGMGSTPSSSITAR